MSNVDHIIADCLDCDKHWEGRYARRNAKRHHDNTGHRVNRETANTWSYP